jgi:hypothetical protein
MLRPCAAGLATTILTPRAGIGYSGFNSVVARHPAAAAEPATRFNPRRYPVVVYAIGAGPPHSSSPRA